MYSTVLFVAALACSTQPAPESTPEQLAIGAVREIVSAQAAHKQLSPDRGYACGLEPLVRKEFLLETWLQGTRVERYDIRVWCETNSTPQATYRAAATPKRRAPGSTLTVCTDETNRLRTVEGDAAMCFAKGAPVR